MIIPAQQCIERLDLFSDSRDLADQLIDLAKEEEAGTAYTMNEAAQNLIGLADLARSMAFHLKAGKPE